MAWKRKVTGGVLAAVGYLLSPLSWWNDAFVNLPLALAFASLISAFYRPAFAVSVVIGYWLTNVLGLVLLHQGTRQLLQDTRARRTWRDWLKDAAVSLLYTGLILLLIALGILKPVQRYFTAG